MSPRRCRPPAAAAAAAAARSSSLPLHEDEIEPAPELPADLLRWPVCSKPRRSCMRIDPPLSASMPATITCLPSARAALEQHPHQRGADALAAPPVGDVDRVLDGEAVAGPGAEVAECGEAGDGRRQCGRRAADSRSSSWSRSRPGAPRASPAPRGRSPSRSRSRRCRSPSPRAGRRRSRLRSACAGVCHDRGRMSTIVTDVTGPLAARLKTEREARGWSVAELAERSGVSRAMISKVERAEASPTAALLGRLSGAFGLTLSALLARAERAAAASRGARSSRSGPIPRRTTSAAPSRRRPAARSNRRSRAAGRRVRRLPGRGLHLPLPPGPRARRDADADRRRHRAHARQGRLPRARPAGRGHLREPHGRACAYLVALVRS